jgi:hypothetical protein
MGTAVAKSGVAPRSLGTAAMKQTRDSGGKIVNPDQKIKSNSPAAAKSVPVTGSGAPPHHAKTARVGDPGAGRIQEGYPGMNVAAAHTTFNTLGGGKVGKKVAGMAKFYGR